MAKIPYTWTENTTNPYEHYNTAKNGELNKKDTYLFFTNIGAWQDKPDFTTIAEQPFLNSYTGKKLSAYRHQLDNAIPGMQKPVIFKDGKDQETFINPTPYNLFRLDTNQLYTKLSKEFLNADGKFDRDTVIVSVTSIYQDQNTGVIIDWPIKLIPFAVKGSESVVFAADKYNVAQDYTLTYHKEDWRIPGDNHNYFSIVKDSKVEFEVCYPPAEFHYEINGKYIADRKLNEDGTYTISLSCKSSPGADFIIFNFGYGFTQAEIANALKNWSSTSGGNSGSGGGGTSDLNQYSFDITTRREPDLLEQVYNTVDTEFSEEQSITGQIDTARFYVERNSNETEFYVDPAFNYFEFYFNNTFMGAVDLNQETPNPLGQIIKFYDDLKWICVYPITDGQRAISIFIDRGLLGNFTPDKLTLLAWQ